MEDEDDIEGAEFVADDAKIEANDDGVENDAEFQDQKGGNLLLEGATAGL